MIELLVIIAVVRLFTKKAESKGLSKGLWGFIGAASYYIPVLLVGFVLLPALVENGTLRFTSEGSAMATALAMMLGAGILCCLIAYRILVNQDSAIKTDESILDQEL